MTQTKAYLKEIDGFKLYLQLNKLNKPEDG